MTNYGLLQVATATCQYQDYRRASQHNQSEHGQLGDNFKVDAAENAENVAEKVGDKIHVSSQTNPRSGMAKLKNPHSILPGDRTSFLSIFTKL